MSDIGRRCLSTFVTGDCLGMGTVSACFQDAGKQPARYEQFNMLVIGPASVSAFSFRTQAGMPSGPCALVDLSANNLMNTEYREKLRIGRNFELSSTFYDFRLKII